MDEQLPHFSETDPPPYDEAYVCPNCGLAIDPSAICGAFIECPHCGNQFLAPVADDEPPDEPSEEHVSTRRAAQLEELEELRIRQFSTLRRTAYRTRSYFIVGSAACLMVAAQIAWAIWHSGPGHRVVKIIAVVVAAGALEGALAFARRVVRVQRGINAELRDRERQEKEAARHEPDFSALSDGSQQARNLERMVGGREEQD